jgi:hypothetical protein
MTHDWRKQYYELVGTARELIILWEAVSSLVVGCVRGRAGARLDRPGRRPVGRTGDATIQHRLQAVLWNARYALASLDQPLRPWLAIIRVDDQPPNHSVPTWRRGQVSPLARFEVAKWIKAYGPTMRTVILLIQPSAVPPTAWIRPGVSLRRAIAGVPRHRRGRRRSAHQR